MIGIDTNVLVRLLTADEANQHAKVLEFFEKRSADDPAFISAVTLAETVWVLQLSYRFNYAEILDAVAVLLETDDFVLEGREALVAAREAGKPAMIADFLVAHLGQRNGCLRTVTLDRRAARAVPAMELLS